MRKESLTAIFSGRYDPPHFGHINTIMKICEEYARVVVVILDYPERIVCSAEDASKIFDDFFDAVLPKMTRNKVWVTINNVHFGKITREYYENGMRDMGISLAHNVYLSGNEEVLRHVKSLGIRTEFIGRSRDDIWEGTKIRKYLNDGRD